MVGGGSKTQTSTTTQQPYGAAKPLLNTAMGDAMDMYKSGDLNAANKIPTAIPFSDQTKQGMGAMENNAIQAMNRDPFQSMLTDFGRTYGNRGYNTEQRTAINALNPTARGDYLNKVDPNFEAVLARTKENAGADVASMMGGMGRFGGGAHQGILADRLGGIESQARLGQYNTERDRQTNAINQMFGMGQQGMQNVGNAGDVWTSLLGGRDAAPNALLGLGSMNEDLAGRQVNDKIRMAGGPLSDIQTLLGIAGGAGGYGTSQAQTPSQSNGWSNALGGGLGLASLLFGG